MTTYHCKVTGSGAGAGTDGDPFRHPDEAATPITAGGATFRSSVDEVLIHYTAGQTFNGWLTSGFTKQGIPFIGVDSSGIRWDTGKHYLTAADDFEGLFSRFEQPRILPPGVDNVVELYQWCSLIGLDLDGNSTSNYCVGGSGAREHEVVDCTLRGAIIRAWTDTENGSIYERLIVHDCPYISTITQACTIKGLEVYDCPGGTYTLDISTALAVVVENVTIANCGATTAAFRASSVNTTFRNALAFKNTSTYGFTGGTRVECNGFTPDGGVYHTGGNFNGGPSGTDTELDPLFADEGANDYALTGASPLSTAGATVTTGLLYYLDGIDVEDPPSIGARTVGDVDGPTFTITSPTITDGATGTATGSVGVVGSASDASEIVSVEWSLDGGAWTLLEDTDAGADYGFAFTVQLDAPGIASLSIRGTDVGNNVGASVISIGYQPALSARAPLVLPKLNDLMGQVPVHLHPGPGGNR